MSLLGRAVVSLEVLVPITQHRGSSEDPQPPPSLCLCFLRVSHPGRARCDQACGPSSHPIPISPGLRKGITNKEACTKLVHPKPPRFVFSQDRFSLTQQQTLRNGRVHICELIWVIPTKGKRGLKNHITEEGSATHFGFVCFFLNKI